MKPEILFVVDKNPIHSSLLKYHLTIQRFQHVQLYHSAEECLSRLKKNIQPRFIITEYELADYNGFDFLKMIKKYAPNTQVIFFSSFDDPIVAMQLIDAGASDFILKTTKLNLGINDLIRNLLFIRKEHFSKTSLD
ncbi:MAG: response regulator [Bacteroidales bacterium]|nr:response regulator [Bacteroidales bacterium]